MKQLVRGAIFIAASVVGGFDAWGIVVVILAVLP
jgi:hypothetical protein